MQIAISYLKRLHASGYFAKEHTLCDGVWLQDHPACENVGMWEEVKDFLVENGYVTVEWLPLEMVKNLNLHPKDELDTWWFNLTPKGVAALL